MVNKGFEILIGLGGSNSESDFSFRLEKLDDDDIQCLRDYVNGHNHPIVGTNIDATWVNLVNDEWEKRIRENRIDKLNDLGV